MKTFRHVGLMIVCPLCSGSQFETVSTFMRHLRLVHADRDGFLLQCGLQGCRRTFRNFFTYRNHVYAYHATGVESVTHRDDPANMVTCGADFESGNDSDLEEPHCDEQPTQALQKAAAVWLLKTREIHRIPLSVMDSITSDVQSLVHVAIGHIQQ